MEGLDSINSFKLPHIATRSQVSQLVRNAKLNMKRDSVYKNTLRVTEPREKRITRSSSKNCLSTNNMKSKKSPGKKHKRLKGTSSGKSDSGYNTTGSYASKDCASITSRDSGLSEMLKSLDGFYTDDSLSDVGSHAVSPPDVSANVRYPHSGRTQTAIILLSNGSTKALVPANNLSNYHGLFKLLIERDGNLISNKLTSDMRIHHISPVISLRPHGIEFFENEPALLLIPLRIEPRNDSAISVLYSNTSASSEPHWQRLPFNEFYVRGSYVVVTLHHFSLFTVIMEEPFPEIMKKIRCRTGGRLRIPEVPGIEVNFPRGCLEHNIDACLRVLFDKDPLITEGGRRPPLASPIISLGPHGLNFNKNRLPVMITLPIPDYEDTMRRCPTARLVAFQSSTVDGNDPMVWQQVNFTLDEPRGLGYRHGISGLPIPTVSFPVHHFSFFKVVWELLSSTLYEAKMGMSYFYPYISFSMMCQAFMEESHENNRFGLEVICYRSDRKLPETTNYRHRVGASLKPKLVRPGKIVVRLRSQMFEADVDAGEDIDMAKEESDFRGRDFEKQYACRFKPDSCVERGPFGKVIVERITTRPDPLFEFNLHKTGVEATENTPSVGCERWTVFAMKELASSLLVSEGNNWKIFAKHIGFTKSEIKNKLTYSADPFLALMNMYNSRGGTPEEFIQALYVVSREIRLGTNTNGNLSRSSGSSRSSRSNESGSLGSGSQESSSPFKRLFRLGSRQHKDSDSAGSNGQNSNLGQKRPLADRPDGENPAKRPRPLEDVSDAPASTSSGELELDQKSESTGKHRNCSRKLNDQDLWRISSGIARKDWRNLGRTLGIEENVLVNLEHSHQNIGFRECAYQMLLEWKGRKPKKCTFGELYSALLREKMNSVAKFMVRKLPSSSDAKNDSDTD